MMNVDNKALAHILTLIIKENHPMLGDFRVKVSKNISTVRPIVTPDEKTIVIPQGWGLERILLEIGPAIKNAALQIEHDAYMIDLQFENHLKALDAYVHFMATLAPDLGEELLDNGISYIRTNNDKEIN